MKILIQKNAKSQILLCDLAPFFSIQSAKTKLSSIGTTIHIIDMVSRHKNKMSIKKATAPTKVRLLI